MKTLLYDRSLKPMTLLAVISAGCSILLLGRIYYSGNYSFIFLIWNLFLAWIPLGLAWYLHKNFQKNPARKRHVFLIGCLWLLFFPNSPYLITDLIHLRPTATIPLWFDSLLLFSFALTGLVAGLLSLYYMHGIMKKLANINISWLCTTSLLVLCSYGIFLGRVQRWNSWDIVTRPWPLLKDVVTHVANPSAILMTGMFSFVLIFSYLVFHALIDIPKSPENDNQMH